MTSRLLIAAAALAVTAACQQSAPRATSDHIATSEAAQVAARLDRGDWMVNRGSRIWKALVSSEAAGEAPLHKGYVIQRRYRQVRGGPEFKMFVVTTLDRDEHIGHIDSLGRAVRYEPRRNGTFDEVPAGIGSLEHSVGAIFQTRRPVLLEETSLAQVAFDAMDRDGNGVLDRNESAAYGATLTRADTNRNGEVDFQEFQSR